ncbi:hypothetical protein OG497_37535 [Streptomyces sp. NBC_01242]|uniref:hypothetical protein n=1 Tax=Streptomyces sp. NBC_01242 TaxID=2903795 RepID=UPI00224E1471|nr:hypothetical protein [Streptomyces sp. NBC_01242]MCX4799560.1 hypothetical protein [Streptomyces sp. NBC_01242]
MTDIKRVRTSDGKVVPIDKKAEPEQLHVKLIPTAARSLALTMELEKLSKTDTVNRAVQVYAFLAEQMASGGEILIRKGDMVEKVHII